MSGGHGAKPQTSHAVMAVALLLLLGLMWLTSRGHHAHGRDVLLAAFGFMLLASTLVGELMEALKLPHLTAYLITGVLAGPHVLGLVDHHAVEDMNFINSLALALIALAGGAALRLDVLRQEFRSIAVATLVQSTFGLVLMAGSFYLARPLMPFVAGLDSKGLLGLALVWGALALSRSPSATLAIISQTRAQGPMTNNALAFIMISNVVVTVIFAAILMVAKPMIDPSIPLSAQALETLGHQLLGSVSVGTTMGLLLAAYMRLVGAQMQLVLVALGFVVWEALRYLSFDAMLAFLVAGFVVQNLSRQGERFSRAIERLSSIVFVIFFTTTGAHLDLPLLGQLWQVSLVLVVARALVSFLGARIASRIVADTPAVRDWGWTSLVAQAGLTFGLVVFVERAFPEFATQLRALVVATVTLNEAVGPVLFKLGLDRAGETSQSPEPTRAAG